MYKTSTTPWRNGQLLALVVATLAVAGCGAADTGPVTTEDRPVGAFQAIRLDGAAQLDVLVGPAPSLSIIGSQDARAAFTALVGGDELHLDSHGSVWKPDFGKVKVRVTVPQLHALNVSGAGQITVSGMSGDGLDVSIDGASNLEANGTIGTLTVSMDGAGNLDLSHLEAVSATVTVNGAGSIQVNATGSLVATVNGVGSINYYGKPSKVTTAINGVGSISPRNRDH
jgi:Putative auto-transporter adhesin, head GIN domain